MGHQIVECPGCLTKLRVRLSQSVIKLSCPRCGELLAVDPPEPASPPTPLHQVPPRSTQPRPASNTRPGPPRPRVQTPAKPDARPTAPPRFSGPNSARPDRGTSGRPPAPPQDDSSGDSGYEPYEPRKSVLKQRESFVRRNRGLISIIGGGGIGLLLLGSLMYWLTRPSEFESSRDQTTAMDAENAAAISPNDTSAAGEESETPFVANPSTDTTPSLSAVSPDAGTHNAVVTAGAHETRRLQYSWKPGAEFVYAFSIQEGENDSVTRTEGVCTYRVEGAVNKSLDEDESSGTGFVVTADGVLATCAHVVEGARRMEVDLAGQTYPAKVIAVDSKSDVALIRIEAKRLPVLPMADSDSIQLAEPVRAIGFPLSDVLGTGVKVTTGTVAGIVQDKQHGRQIQIDAAINPGNSGGPVVNEAGQVIGVASAKLSGASVTSVAFAAPVNQVRQLATSVNLQLPRATAGQDLSGPEVARRVTPSVAYIRVWGNVGGGLFNVGFTANYTAQRQQSMRAGLRFPGPGAFMFPSNKSDEGRLVVNSLGEILEYQGNEQLPAVLGPVGMFFLEPLDAHSESQWQTETESNLQRINRSDEGPFGGAFGRRRGFHPPGFHDPFGGDRKDEVLETIPATEKKTYRVDTSLNNKISIAKSYEFAAIRSTGQPYLNIRGSGTVVFDTERGMPSSLEFQSRIQQHDEGATTDIPVRINYTLRSIEELQREKDRLEADRLRTEQEKANPSPELVDELLAEIRTQEGSIGAAAPLMRLSEIAVVDAKRDDVLRVVRNHMTNSNDFVRQNARGVFCAYATVEHLPELREMVADSENLSINGRKKLCHRLAEFGTDEDHVLLIGLVNDPFLRAEIREILISIGTSIEDPILQKIDSVKDFFARNELLEVLRKIGTLKSVPKLEEVAKIDSLTAIHANRALDAIRARQ